MEIINLASSSTGNCYIVYDGSSYLLLEAGIPYKKIVSKLNDYNLKLTDFVGCVVSHSHNDHSCAINELSRFMPVYGSEETVSNVPIKKYILRSATKTVVGSFNVIAFDTEHDCEGSLGFIIQSQTTKESLLFLTDTKYIKYALKDFKLDYIMIECNYVDELLETQEINYALKKRLLNSHMSLVTCIKTLKSLSLKDTKEIYLIHLSDSRSDENLMQKEVAKATGKVVYVCKKNGGIL